MRWIIFLVLVLLNGCCEVEPETHYLLNPDVILSTEIGKKVFRQLREEHDLYLAEYGWSMEGLPKIRGLHCSFFHYEEANIEKAREILLKIIELLLLEINAHKHLHPHLTHYPFTSESIDILIFLTNPDFSPFGVGKLCGAQIVNGILNYKIDSSDHKKLITIHTETYKEAQAKLQMSPL